MDFMTIYQGGTQSEILWRCGKRGICCEGEVGERGGMRGEWKDGGRWMILQHKGKQGVVRRFSAGLSRDHNKTITMKGLTIYSAVAELTVCQWVTEQYNR